jgi:hypothetical protein
LIDVGGQLQLCKIAFQARVLSAQKNLATMRKTRSPRMCRWNGLKLIAVFCSPHRRFAGNSEVTGHAIADAAGKC